MKRKLLTATSRWVASIAPVVRLGYLHMFLADGQFHSTIHVQNPFSFFDPSGEHSALVRVGLFNRDGKKIAQEAFSLGPFESLHKDVEDLAPRAACGSYGTVSVDIQPPPAYRKFLKQNSVGFANIASPFWMRLSHDNGSEAYVHSIEADRSRLYGVPSLISKFVLNSDTDSCWESDRTISLGKGESVKAFLINHSAKDVSPEIQWRGRDGSALASQRLEIPSRGIRSLEFGGEYSGDVYASVTGLPTPNSKPYVMVFTPTGQFGLTHG